MKNQVEVEQTYIVYGLMERDIGGRMATKSVYEVISALSEIAVKNKVLAMQSEGWDWIGNVTVKPISEAARMGKSGETPLFDLDGMEE